MLMRYGVGRTGDGIRSGIHSLIQLDYYYAKWTASNIYIFGNMLRLNLRHSQPGKNPIKHNTIQGACLPVLSRRYFSLATNKRTKPGEFQTPVQGRGSIIVQCPL